MDLQSSEQGRKRAGQYPWLHRTHDSLCDTSEESLGEESNSLSSHSFRKPSSSGSGNSSDPIFFSEDDLQNASITNYDSPRRRIKLKGSWWKHGTTSRSAHNTNVSGRDTRFLKSAKPTKDSGVFVLSSDSDDERNLAAIAKRNEKSARPMFSGVEGHSNASLPLTTAVWRKRSREEAFSPYETLRCAVRDCLENEKDTLDLSHMRLQHIPNRLLRPMRDLVIPPKYHTGTYASFKPELKLFASFNGLREVPSELANLTALHTLSLRHNDIKEMPHNMHRLKNLRSLNIAVNSIRFLPFSLLQLMNTTSGCILNAQGNPFFDCLESDVGCCRLDCDFADVDALTMQAEQDAGCKSSTPDEQVPEHVVRHRYLLDIYTFRQARCMELIAMGLHPRGVDFHARAEPIYIGSTFVTFYDADRVVPPECKKPLWRTDDPCTAIIPIADIDPCAYRPVSMRESTSAQRRIRQLPTLFELCARVASKSKEFDIEDEDTFRQLIRDMPESCIEAAHDARIAADAGGYECSVCGGEYVIARAEWIEYWFAGSTGEVRRWNHMFLPFLRQACSWACAEQAQESNREYWRRYANHGSRRAVRAGIEVD